MNRPILKRLILRIIVFLQSNFAFEQKIFNFLYDIHLRLFDIKLPKSQNSKIKLAYEDSLLVEQYQLIQAHLTKNAARCYDFQRTTRARLVRMQTRSTDHNLSIIPRCSQMTTCERSKTANSELHLYALMRTSR